MRSPAADNSPASKPGGPRALVTGGAGFIGSHLVERLLADGARVTIVDDLSTGRVENLAGARDQVRFIEDDLRHALEGELADATFDEVYHLAAAVGVDLVMREPVRAIETNVELTSALLRFAEGVRPGGVPTLIASSSEVYGKPGKELFSEEDDVLYGPTSVTRWSYACSKAIDEYLALAYAREGRCPAVVVRLFNTVGPRQVGDYGMVVPRFVRAAIEGKPLRVFGDGSQSRCFCDVRDVVGALTRLVREPAGAGRVFNLGSDSPTTIMELAELVVETLGSDSQIVKVPYSDAYPAGFEDLRHRKPDLTRVRELIAFGAAVPLATTIRDIASELARKGAPAAGESG
ncbi:MAG: NAD-dependent epimerase/dehydratase family protein [Phycisphaerales bacterium]